MYITKEIIQHVLDLPISEDKELPTATKDAKDKEEYLRIFKVLMKVKEKFPGEAPNENQDEDGEDAATSDVYDATASTEHAEKNAATSADADATASAEHADKNVGSSADALDSAAASAEHAEKNTAASTDALDSADASTDEVVGMKANEIRQFFSAPNIALLAIKYCDEDIAKLIDMDMLVKLFLGVVFDILLMPGKSNYITKATLESLQDLEKFKNIDWSYVVYERLKKACDEFVKSRDMNCCMAVFLVVFMDCIERNDLNREQDGRINLYNDKLVKQLLCEQPIQQVDVMKKRKITKLKGPHKRGQKGAKPL